MVIRINDAGSELVKILETLNRKDIPFHVINKGNGDIIIRIPEDHTGPEQVMSIEQFNIAARFNFKVDLGDVIMLQMKEMFDNDKMPYIDAFYMLSDKILEFFFSCYGILEDSSDTLIQLKSSIDIDYDNKSGMHFNHLDGFFIGTDNKHYATISNSDNSIISNIPICEVTPQAMYDAFCQINKMKNSIK